MTYRTPSFPDHDQNFWELACIQCATQGVPGIMFGGILAEKYGASQALSSIFIGNALMWLVGLAMIAIALKGRKNVIQVAQDYLGNWGGILFAAVITLALVVWYAVEIDSTVSVLQDCGFFKTTGMTVGFVLGGCVAVLSWGGIRLIKIVSVWSFPLLLAALFYMLFSFAWMPEWGAWKPSFAGIMTVAMFNLAGFVNLPTFFRHSFSKADSILALGLTVIVDTLIEVVSVFVGRRGFLDALTSHSFFFFLVVILFVLILFAGVNLTNAYYASVGIETLIRGLRRPWSYICVGVIGTFVYILFFGRHPVVMESIQLFFSNCMIGLGVILLMGFFKKIVNRRDPVLWEKGINFFCWLIGCGIALMVQWRNPRRGTEAFSLGAWASVLSFSVIFFVQQMLFWASKVRRIGATEE